MPDGDVVYHGVGRGYIAPYKELCEGRFSDEQIAADLAKSLRNGLKRYGNPPVNIIFETVDDLAQGVERGIHLDVSEESRQIDDCAHRMMGHRRGMPIAVDACKSLMLASAAGEGTEQALHDTVRDYIERVLNADFVERLPLHNLHDKADPEEVAQRLKRVLHHLVPEIDSMVANIVKNQNVDGLRKRPSQKQPPPDFSQIDVSLK